MKNLVTLISALSFISSFNPCLADNSPGHGIDETSKNELAIPKSSLIVESRKSDQTEPDRLLFNMPTMSPGISVSIAYGMDFLNTYHHIEAKKAKGFVALNSDGKLITAEFAVAVQDLDTGIPLRDCHLRQSLTMNYDLSGINPDCQYPNEDKCSANVFAPQIIATKAVVYPEIQFRFNEKNPENLKLTQRRFTVGRYDMILVAMDISIHGVKKTLQVPISTHVLSENRIKIQSKFNLNIRDFGIQVKSFVGFGVDDIAQITIDSELIK